MSSVNEDMLVCMLRESDDENEKLRELNAELVEALHSVLKDRSLYELSFTAIDLAQTASAKAKKLK